MTQLPEPGEPIVLADGTKIDPSSGKVIREKKFVEVPRNSEAVRKVTQVRRQLADLPVPPKQMNAVGLVVFYKMIGLSNYDTALAMNVTESQIHNIMELDVYQEMMESMRETVLKNDADDVRQMFMQHSHNAVHRIVSLIDEGEEKVALAAAKDVLDRAGHRPADVIEHRMKVEGDLKIEVIKRDEGKSKDLPDVEYAVLEDDDGDG